MPSDRQFRSCDVAVHGRVQGVGFRYSVLWEAEEIGLAGFARNEPDGSVTLHLEGLGYQTDRLLAWLRSGDHRFKIRRMHRKPAKSLGLTDFRIIY